jgi:hypothetical protein
MEEKVEKVRKSVEMTTITGTTRRKDKGEMRRNRSRNEIAERHKTTQKTKKCYHILKHRNECT